MVVSWRLRSGRPRPSLFGHQCTVGILAGTHRCATESKVTLWQSANPCCVFVGVVTSCVPCARVRGRASRTCATENAYTPARLEALSKLSAGCGCTLQLVILLKIPSKFYCLLYAVSQAILFTQIQLCSILGRLINFERCRVCPWVSLQSSRRETRCTSCPRRCEQFQL